MCSQLTSIGITVARIVILSNHDMMEVNNQRDSLLNEYDLVYVCGKPLLDDDDDRDSGDHDQSVRLFHVVMLCVCVCVCVCVWKAQEGFIIERLVGELYASVFW